METRRRAFLNGMRDTFPLIVGAIPFGIIFGTLSGSIGLPAGAAIGMSLFVFAGSSQFVALGLLASGTAWPLIVWTTLVVNFRHLLYTATLLPHLKPLPVKWQVPLAFGLTDETFAVSVGRWRRADAGMRTQWYQLGSTVFMYVNWNVCTVLGLIAGRWLQDIGAWGLEFAMIAAFIGMLMPFLKDRPSYCAVLASGLGSLVFYSLPFKLGLMAATLFGVAAGVLAAHLNRQPHGAGEDV